MTTAVERTLPEVDAAAPLQRIAEAVAEVQEMNSDSWALFDEHGLGADDAVQLECTFAMGTEESAHELAEYLQTIALYDAVAVSPATEFDTWAVRAVTEAVTVTEAGLTEWVRRLAAVGYANGDAELDGWTLLIQS